MLTDNNTNNSNQNTDSNNNNVDCRTGVIFLKRTTSNAGDGCDQGGGGENLSGRIHDQRRECLNDQSSRGGGCGCGCYHHHHHHHHHHHGCHLIKVITIHLRNKKK